LGGKVVVVVCGGVWREKVVGGLSNSRKKNEGGKELGTKKDQKG